MIVLISRFLFVIFYLHLVAAEPFLSGSSGTYVEAMYESWQNDHASVHKVCVGVGVSVWVWEGIKGGCVGRSIGLSYVYTTFYL